MYIYFLFSRWYVFRWSRNWRKSVMLTAVLISMFLELLLTTNVQDSIRRDPWLNVLWFPTDCPQSKTFRCFNVVHKTRGQLRSVFISSPAFSLTTLLKLGRMIPSFCTAHIALFLWALLFSWSLLDTLNPPLCLSASPMGFSLNLSLPGKHSRLCEFKFSFRAFVFFF